MYCKMRILKQRSKQKGKERKERKMKKKIKRSWNDIYQIGPQKYPRNLKEIVQLEISSGNANQICQVAPPRLLLPFFLRIVLVLSFFFSLSYISLSCPSLTYKSFIVFKGNKKKIRTIHKDLRKTQKLFKRYSTYVRKRTCILKEI